MASIIKDRVNWKVFKDTEIPDEHIAILDETIGLCPIQRNSMPVPMLFKCGKSDSIVKQQLSRYVFKNASTGWWEVGPITAPLVYFCIVENMNDEHFPQQKLHAGIIGGALMTQAIHLGYDCSFIGCTEDPSLSEKEIIRNTLLKRFNKDIGTNFLSFLALCIGEGVPDTETQAHYTLDDGTTIPYNHDISQDPPKPTVIIS